MSGPHRRTNKEPYQSSLFFSIIDSLRSPPVALEIVAFFSLFFCLLFNCFSRLRLARFSLSASFAACAAERRLRRIIRRFLPGFFLDLGCGVVEVVVRAERVLGESFVDFAVRGGFAPGVYWRWITRQGRWQPGYFGEK